MAEYGQGLKSGKATLSGVSHIHVVFDKSFEKPNEIGTVLLTPASNVKVWVEDVSNSGFNILSDDVITSDVYWLATV